MAYDNYKLLVVIAVILMVYSVKGDKDNKQETKKNVLIVIADDLGFESQVYNNSICRTPNLDSLASRSVIIRHAYTSVSSCSPSRSAILTGLPVHQSGQFGLAQSENNFHTYDVVRSLPVILKTSGIKTGIIGKKHVAPQTVFKFDYEKTELTNGGVLQVGRNVTFMKEKVRQFFDAYGDNNFLLYIGLSDPLRIGDTTGEFGEKWGSGLPGMGIIPDWTPVWYTPDEVIVPPFLPDTPATRADIAAQYTSISRMDAAIGMLIAELTNHGYLNDTLIIFTSDNGIPFPNAKTNLYEPGMAEPMLISSPIHSQRWGEISDALTSTLDITPTVLDWFGIDYPDYVILGKKVTLTGKSLLPLTQQEPSAGWDSVYASHIEHEATMYYPMRALRSKYGNSHYRLIHNLNNRAPYPIAGDIYPSPTYQDLLNRSHQGRATHWFKNLQEYYYRPEMELYDVTFDPLEATNLAQDGQYADVLTEMAGKLKTWQNVTHDPWICFPHGIRYKGGCGQLYNLDLDKNYKMGYKIGLAQEFKSTYSIHEDTYHKNEIVLGSGLDD